MRSHASRALMVVVCVFTVSVLWADDSQFTLRRGVIVDGGREALYLPDPTGEIEALDLSAGRVLWSSSEAALPLAIDGSLLVAQGEETRWGRLPIVVIDVSAGGRKVVGAIIPLPDDVRALISDEANRSFRATAERQGNQFLISWTYREILVQGKAPVPEGPLPTRIVTGSARLDLGTGVVVANETTDQRTGEVSVPPTPVLVLEGRTNESTSLQAKAAPRTVRQSSEPKLLRYGNVIAKPEGGRGGPLTLKRWDATSGAALPDLLLVNKAIVALPSAEEKHLLASERVGVGGPQDPEYRWSIFSIETGERVTELRRDASAAPFFIWNDEVILESRPYGYRVGDGWVEEPLKIRSIRLSRGVPVWDREVRHLEYRGPLPPAR